VENPANVRPKPRRLVDFINNFSVNGKFNIGRSFLALPLR
jgi:hypothetical protein